MRNILWGGVVLYSTSAAKKVVACLDSLYRNTGEDNSERLGKYV